MIENEPKGCLFALLEILGLASKPAKNNGGEIFPYRCKEYLLTKAERAFFDVLYPIVHNHMHLFAMVRLADLVYISPGTEKRQSFFNKIQSKHIDFVLCSKEEIKPILAIELDDISHQKPDRQARDEFLDQALRHAGLPLLRVQARRRYDPQELKQQIKSVLTNSGR